VLERSFIHVPGIGATRERRLWEQGYVDWASFLAHHPRDAWRALVAANLDRELAARTLPRREHWRLAAEFPGRTAFLDIETEGLDPVRDAITCVGLSDGTSAEAFVRGENLMDFPEAIRRFDLLVTYNGLCFDLPVLRRFFPIVDFGRFHHIDLRYPLHRLGVKGGLKGAERQLGIARSEEIEGADGFLAVLLWREHGRGRAGALETLLRYCLEDVVHLKPLLDHAYNALTQGLPFPVTPLDSGPLPEIPWRADGALVRSLLGRRDEAWASDPVTADETF
jgi:hypothetical protein